MVVSFDASFKNDTHQNGAINKHHNNIMHEMTSMNNVSVNPVLNQESQQLNFNIQNLNFFYLPANLPASLPAQAAKHSYHFTPQ